MAMETIQIPQFQQHHRLALAMEWADVDNSDMAAELGVHRNTISNYLNGHTRPSKSVLKQWAIRTGAPFDWLETGAITEPINRKEGCPWGVQMVLELAGAA